jgi:hypothetical protein
MRRMLDALSGAADSTEEREHNPQTKQLYSLLDSVGPVSCYHTYRLIISSLMPFLFKYRV